MMTPRTQPTVSVVIPCHNAAATVGNTIQSVLDQTHPCVEIIAIDDGSSDTTTAVLAGFVENITYETGPKRGAAAARNRGLTLSSGECILFLDADDLLSPDAMAGLAAAYAEYEADMVIGRWSMRWPDREVEGSDLVARAKTNDAALCAWLDGDWVPPVAVLWRTAFVRGLGGWSETLQRNQDGDLALRALATEGMRRAQSRFGQGVYVQHDGAGRVSKTVTEKSVGQQLDVLKDIEKRLAGQMSAQLQAAFADAYYRVSREAFRLGFERVGVRALEHARCRGLTGHSGSALHSAAATLLGLGRKERFVSQFAAARKRIFN